MKVSTIGIDLAKRVFQVHELDQHGKGILRKSQIGDHRDSGSSRLTKAKIIAPIS